jgi:Tol biopolymer transport system component
MAATRWRLAVAGLVVLVLLSGVSMPTATAVSPGSVELLSRATNGTQPSGGAFEHGGPPAITPDGDLVAFAGRSALDPVDGANDGEDPDFDVYVRDRRSPGRTVLISRAGREPAEGNSRNPSVSGDGRFVAFDTDARNIVERPGADRGVVICDRDPDGDGVFDEPRADGAPDYRYVVVGRHPYHNSTPSLSAGATTVAWAELDSGWRFTRVARLAKDGAGRLVPPPASEYETLSPPDGTGVGAADPVPRVSSDGEHVAFTARLCEPTYCWSRVERQKLSSVYVADLRPPRVFRLDVDADGRPLPGTANQATVSSDGRRVAFTIAENGPGSENVVLVDRDPDRDGALGPGDDEPVRTTLASRTATGGPGGGDRPALSSDGRYLAFATAAPGMHNGTDPQEALPHRQVVVRDVVSDARREAAGLPRLPAELASRGLDDSCAPESCAGTGISHLPALSSDGRVVSFSSSAGDLVSDDENSAPDVFATTFRPTLSPDPADYGPVEVGQLATRKITLRHNGFGPLRITGVHVTGSADFSLTSGDRCRDTVLHTTDTCPLSVRFAPVDVGPRQARLVVGLGTAAEPVSVPLTGIATPDAALTVSPAQLDFGERLTLSASGPATVTVTNPGAVSKTVSGALLPSGPHLFPDDFTVTDATCGGPLPAGASCTFTVLHIPHGSGARPGTLRIATSADPLPVSLLGRGTTPVVTAEQGVVATGRVIQLSGSGFPANSAVSIDTPDRHWPQPDVPTDATGAFSHPLVVFDDAPIGTATVHVTSPGTQLEAETTILVAQGTFQPTSFLWRR